MSPKFEQPKIPDVKPEVETAVELGKDILEHFSRIMSDLYDLQGFLKRGEINDEEYDQILQMIIGDITKHESYFRFFQNFFAEHSSILQGFYKRADDNDKKRTLLNKLFADTRIPFQLRTVLGDYQLEEDKRAVLSRYVQERNIKYEGKILDEWNELYGRMKAYINELEENINYANRTENREIVPQYQKDAGLLATSLELYAIPFFHELVGNESSDISKKDAEEIQNGLEDIAAKSQTIASAHTQKSMQWLPPHIRK